MRIGLRLDGYNVHLSLGVQCLTVGKAPQRRAAVPPSRLDYDGQMQRHFA